MPRVAKWIGDAVEGWMGSKIPFMTVLETSSIHPNIGKVRFRGDIAEMDFQLGYAVAIRVSDTEYRNYTAAFSDPGEGILEIIYHRHGDAPGSRFMSSLAPGKKIRISMPRGKKMYDPSADRHILFGDETSLGLARAFQYELDKTRRSFHCCLELGEENKHIPQLLGLKNYTVVPKRDTFQHEDRLEELPVFPFTGTPASHFILTGNARSVQTIRNFIKKKKISGKILAQAYWAEGKAGL